MWIGAHRVWMTSTLTIFGRCHFFKRLTAAYTFSECLVKQKRMCLGKCTPCVRQSCTCIPTDMHMWQRYTNSVHVCLSFVRNFLWRSLIYRLLDEHWQTANKHDRMCSFIFAAKSTLGKRTHSLVFGQTHPPSVYAALQCGKPFYVLDQWIWKPCLMVNKN